MNFQNFIHISSWRRLFMLAGATLFPVILALLLSGFVPVIPPPPFVVHVIPLKSIGIMPAHELEVLYEKVGYVWPPQEKVPALAVHRLPRDIDSLAISRRKALFFRTLLPLVVAENQRLLGERRWLEGVLHQGEVVDHVQRHRLQRLLREYGMDEDAEMDMALLKRLYHRIDMIPPGLVLAQAANESGWGTSRFSKEVNNLFGEWTYRAEHGVLPLRRPEGATHYVRRFENLRDSVESYLKNLNRNRAYRSLRQIRARMRQQGHEPDAITLAEGLKHYSARGEKYVSEIRAMIHGNDLNDLGPLRLVHSATAG